MARFEKSGTFDQEILRDDGLWRVQSIFKILETILWQITQM